MIDNNINWESIAVDGACSVSKGDFEYRGVDTKTGKQIFKAGVFKNGTNNIAEFLALVHALAYLKNTKQFNKPIYSDSQIAIKWIKQKRVKTRMQKNDSNKHTFDLIKRGEAWLINNTYKNPILKWHTKSWGEIPADFGRKKEGKEQKASKRKSPKAMGNPITQRKTAFPATRRP